MDGGLAHLRAVVVDDSLGLADEMEAAMARHIEGYADEWKSTLDDTERLRRFVSFVNAPHTPDPSITFEIERDQPVPADPARSGRQPVLLGMPR
jgi:nitrite reductase (NADH) large subunit